MLWSVNAAFSRYTGYAYFPRALAPLAFLPFVAWRSGRALRRRRPAAAFALESLGWYGAIAASAAFLITAIQYTPFPPIDAGLVAADRALGVEVTRAIAWTAERPRLASLLVLAYRSTEAQLVLVPLIPILGGDRKGTSRFLRALAIASLAGSLFYYLWPSSGPASVLDSPHFYAAQRLTGVKFAWVHSRMEVQRGGGGMIAFPSFHVAWSILLADATRGDRRWFWPVAALNAVVIASTFLLGWHFLVDLFGGAALALGALGAAAL